MNITTGKILNKISVKTFVYWSHQNTPKYIHIIIIQHNIYY